MIKLRVTIDIDTDNPITLFITLLKGVLVCKRFPYKVRKTGKGYHIVFRGLKIDEETMYKYRMLIGDDENRIKLDMDAKKRIKQVLFSEKETIYYGYLFSKWLPDNLFKKISPNGEWITKCPVCNRRIEKSVKVWRENKKCIVIYHIGHKRECFIPLKEHFL